MCKVLSKLRQNITSFRNLKHAYPQHLGALIKAPKFTMKLVFLANLYCLEKPILQNMPDVVGEHQFIMLENFEIIFIFSKIGRCLS